MTFDTVRQLARGLPDVEATTNWAGLPVLKAGGSFMAGVASHESAEPDTLVVRCEVDDRERFIEDAPETYYITDYYERYPLVLVRLAQVTDDAVRELLVVSRQMAMRKARRGRQPRGRTR